MIFALGLSLLLLSGCVASVGPEYGGYYPPAPRPYYGYARPYYAPRPVIVVPARPYRQGYGGYRGDGGHGGYHGGGYNGGGGHHGGGGHGRGR